jgi:hypothetical protein
MKEWAWILISWNPTFVEGVVRPKRFRHETKILRFYNWHGSYNIILLELDTIKSNSYNSNIWTDHNTIE